MKLPTRRAASQKLAEGQHDPVWLLDLDNTLHNAIATTFPRIKIAMGDFIEQELGLSSQAAGDLRDQYGRRYGATLLGLVKHHGVDAAAFLRHAHDLPDLPKIIRPNMQLANLLRRLPGRRVLLTNAPRDYAKQVIHLLGIKALLHEVVSIESMGFAGRLQPKPSRPMFRRLIAAQRVPASHCILVEDSVANLRGAQGLGVRGVLVTQLGGEQLVMRQAARAMAARGLVRQIRTVRQLPHLWGRLAKNIDTGAV